MENPLADVDQIEKIADPAERAREVGRRMALVTDWHSRLREIRQAAVIEMKDGGMSLADIGRELGLHRNRVQQILEGRSAGGQGGKRREQPNAEATEVK
jgi:hypothetical protein